jgi:hypothetical protein
MGIYVGHSLAHSGNVPVIYNPQTTHITPQFHVVFDDQFSTVTCNPSTFTVHYMEALYNKSSWIHKDNYADTEDMHLFETFWSAPPSQKERSNKTTKRKSLATQPSHNTMQITKKILSELAITSELALNSELADTGEHAHESERAPSNKIAINSEQGDNGDHAQENKLTKPSEQPSESERAQEINFNDNKRLNIATLPVAATILHKYPSMHGIVTNSPEPHPNIPSRATVPNDMAMAPTGPIHDSVKSRINLTSFPVQKPKNTFISLLTYAFDPDDLSSQPTAYTACNNKEYILTQSQMLKASDSDAFIECQHAEKAGLKQFGVMDIEHISQLPTKAKLLSSIWSYRRKQLPN